MDVLALTRRFTHSTSELDFRKHFGGPPNAISFLCQLIIKKCSFPKSWNLDHLFMCLFFLKSPCPSWEVVASRFNVHRQTFEKKIWESLQLINEVLPEVLLNFFIKVIL